jgi:hypothetical protein
MLEQCRLQRFDNSSKDPGKRKTTSHIARIEEGTIIAVQTPTDLKRDPDPRIQHFLNVYFKTPNPGADGLPIRGESKR